MKFLFPKKLKIFHNEEKSVMENLYLLLRQTKGFSPNFVPNIKETPDVSRKVRFHGK